VPFRCARTGGALGREALDAGAVASGEASRPALGREALDAPRRCAGTDAGCVIGREALDAGAVASGASIRRARRGAPLRATQCRRRALPLDVPRRVLSWRARTDGVFWDRE
jgi:hypothetical protein